MGISVAQLGCFCKGVSMAARLLQSFKSCSFFRWRWEIGAYLPMTQILRCQPGAACAFSDTARGYSRSENHRLPPFDMPPGSAKKIIQQIQIFAQFRPFLSRGYRRGFVRRIGRQGRVCFLFIHHPFL
jgi:hypothetical protein